MARALVVVGIVAAVVLVLAVGLTRAATKSGLLQRHLAAWQLVTVTPADVTESLAAPDATVPPFVEAQTPRACLA